MQFLCQQRLVGDLQKQAKEMEDELEMWNREVAMARKRFYELNYYTTRQLLVLRSELGKMKSPGKASSQSQQAQVMALLESISSKITPRDMVNIVQHVAIQLVEDRRSPVTPTLEDAQDAGVHTEPSPDNFSLPLLPPVNQLEDTPPAVDHPVACAQSLHVSLSREQLNEKQNEHFINIIAGFGLSEMIALKAIEEVGDGDWNEIENWIQENGEKYEELFQKEEKVDEEVEEDGEESENDEEMNYESGDQDEDSGRDPSLGKFCPWHYGIIDVFYCFLFSQVWPQSSLLTSVPPLLTPRPE